MGVVCGLGCDVRLLFLLWVCFGGLGWAEVPIRGLAWPGLSHDGEQLAFEWLGDLWVAPAEGGEARRVVKSPAREAYPKFSVDGERLVFSSERSGTVQVWSVNLEGKDLRQHSFHTEGNVLEGLTGDGNWAVVRGERGASGYRPTRLMYVDLRGDGRERMVFDATAHSSSVSSDGYGILFCQGGEQLYRKGYRGSRAGRIYHYDEGSNEFTKLVDDEMDARSPMWVPGEKAFYYVSGRSGEMNVWRRELGGGDERQVTNFEGDGVVLPVLSGDGRRMVFRVGEELYLLDLESGGKAERVSFYTREKKKVRGRAVRRERVSGTSEVCLAPGGERVVFEAAGDLWVTEAGGENLRRMTETDGVDESQPMFTKEGRYLIYTKDDGREMGIWRAEWDEGQMGEGELMHGSERSKDRFQISPDGGRLAWVEATGDLMVMNLEDGEVVKVKDCWDRPTYDWAPDGKWLVVASKDKHSNRDLYIVAADGSGEEVNLTAHPAFEGSPRWSPDGEKIVFIARRGEGGIARFWMVDVGDGFDEVEIEEVATEIGEPIRTVWAEDSKGVYFQSRDEDDEAVYRVSLEDGEVEQVAEFRGLPVSMRDGLWSIGRVPTVVEIGEDEMREFPISVVVEQDREARSRLGFRRIWRTLGERFYDPGMNGRDWNGMLEKYEDLAAGARDSRQFDRVVARLLGELNASHLTFRAKRWGLGKRVKREKKRTAHLGLEFTNAEKGPLVISKVLEGAPVAKVEGAPRVGEILRRINGKEVTAGSSLRRYREGMRGKSLAIVVENGEGEERGLELVPISYRKARGLDREAKVGRAKDLAGEDGFTYLPFRRMKAEDLRDLEVEVYRASLESEGIVLDLRDNAGGRVADELLAMFCQPVHTFTIPRGGPRGYPADRRAMTAWEGPMVVLCNENTFSNAEIFCHAFKGLDRGPLVGQPTNGGVISAVSVTIPEVGRLQVPFRGWYEIETGKDLELNGAVPDVLVEMGPADQLAGEDPQLEEAMRLLREEEAISEVPGIFKHGGKVKEGK